MTGVDLPNLGAVEVSSPLEARQYAGALLAAVLEEKIEPRMAINRWPENLDDSLDVSLACALLALWHFEADTERQKTELFYMDIQWNLLKQMADCLNQGEDLPPYILQQYWPQVRKNRVRFFYTRTFWNDLWHMLGSEAKRVSRVFRQAWLLLPKNK